MNIHKYLIAVSLASSLMLSTFGASVASASTVNAPSGIHGPWAVQVLTVTSDIESFKVDRNLVAWTERNDALGVRYLRVWDGAKTQLLAAIDIADWSGSDYYPAVEGNYDVADGAVVWTMNDGFDNEIYVYRNGRVERLTDNNYEDKHPITSAGRIVWTADMDYVYKLMVSDSQGVRSLEEYHVMNYVLSGSNLYWLDTVAGGNVMHVYRNGGVFTEVLGEAEVRPYDFDYLLTDGNGAVAWEVLHENWGQFGMNVVYGSDTGRKTDKLFERVRWFNEIRVEDLRGSSVLVNNHDVQSISLADTYLLHSFIGREVTVDTIRAMAKARFSDDAHVRHQTANTSSPLVVYHNDGTGGLISSDRIRLEMFDANDGTIAAAYNEDGGLMLYKNREVNRIPTYGKDVTSLATRGDTTAFVYGSVGAESLAVATPAVLVGNSVGAVRVAGRLVTAELGQAVYLATADGNRYVFPGEGQFYSWFNNFESLQVISANDLAAMPLVGTVLYPTRTLVKTPSSPRVYAVGADGQLHWVTDGLVLSMLYGDNWNRQVHDLPASFFTSYRLGGPVDNSIGYYSVAITE
ncbi:MAG: hypothetical protein V1738_01985 [Patescibacteria group bacterium]